jgi:hypothetical protein
MVQARAIVGVADIHARALANRVKSTQNLDGAGIVLFDVALGRDRCVGHGFAYRLVNTA